MTGFSIGEVQDMDAAYVGPDQREGQPMQQAGEPLDVTITNTGAQVGLITGFRITITAVAELDSCAAVGGGVDVTAAYDARVPVPIPEAPFDVSGDIRFEVAAGSNDRLAIFVGPAVEPASSAVDAWLYSGRLTLIESSGREMQTGPFTVVAPRDDAAYSLEFAEPEYAGCVAGNADLLANAVRTGGQVSSILTRLSEGYSAKVAD